MLHSSLTVHSKLLGLYILFKSLNNLCLTFILTAHYSDSSDAKFSCPEDVLFREL